MPSYDFAVDLQALVTAAQETAAAVQDVKDHDVEDFVPDEDTLGSDTVWAAVDEFQSRWERGVNDMVGDVEEVSGRIGKVAMTYAEFDQSGLSGFAAARSAVTALAAAAVPGGGSGD